jgi:hypothetical protein
LSIFDRLLGKAIAGFFLSLPCQACWRVVASLRYSNVAFLFRILFSPISSRSSLLRRLALPFLRFVCVWLRELMLALSASAASLRL